MAMMRRRSIRMRRVLRFTPIQPVVKSQTRMRGRRVGRNMTPGVPRRIGRYRPAVTATGRRRRSYRVGRRGY